MDPMIFKNAEEAYDFLEGVVSNADEILRLIGDSPEALSDSDKTTANRLFRGFKTCLREYYDQKKELPARDYMGAGEAHFVFPAIHEANALLTLPLDSVPSQKWIDEINAAKNRLLFYLRQVRTQP